MCVDHLFGLERPLCTCTVIIQIIWGLIVDCCEDTNVCSQENDCHIKTLRESASPSPDSTEK